MASPGSITTKAATTTDTTAISDQVRAAGGIASHGLARSLEALRGLAFGHLAAATNRPRSVHGRLHVQRRHLSGGAIAGVTVGVVVAVALLAICLYPCLLYLKRRRSGQPRPAFDAEAAMAAAAAGNSGSSTSGGGASSPPKRLSSSDSYRPKAELTRGGDFGDRGSNDYGDWGRQPVDNGGVGGNGYALPLSAAYLQPGDPGLVENGLAEEYRVRAAPFPLLGCYDGEFAPPMADDHQPGVLKGTSADYYSPDIPSEAFGMVTQPDPALESPIQPASSRASSLRHNMMQMFRRKSARDATLDSTLSRTTITEHPPRSADASPQLDGATPLQAIITAADRVESPTNISSASLPLSSRASSQRRQPADQARARAQAQAQAPAGAPAGAPAEEVEASLAPASPPFSSAAEPCPKTTPPESPPSSFPSYQQFRKSPSPPVAAPGTVNPMDIMPASTESEVWHRTEHQLYEAFHKPPPSGPAALPPQEGFANGTSMPSPSPTPPETQAQPILTVQSPDSANHTIELTIPDHGHDHDHDHDHDNNNNNSSSSNSNGGGGNSNHQTHTQFDSGDVAMLDATALPPNPDHGLAAPDGRHPSYPSDQSTPLPGPSFTDVSSQNTPSTQLDTPSPESVGSSDFRHSASPHSGAGSHSPRTGVYRCDEPGCNQFFDQPHKLKHHQRYHSKDHKCPYPGCGKGFGTKTHLQRHINDRHEKKKKFHCSVAGCDYSRAGGKAFPRKDNWKRHMIKIHNIEQQQLPEPIEVDMDVDGI
ncbi:hypothetical protein Trco_003499 [Trichoderma cornu-damae]|uniref:C2H2-type domain-containing protein n=1 Tax=Trichoderma cornu-damae TaxID=654480 RepID=A0A9P8QL64_9HYPO|nr:hypothetical protein Trco_003499 [Trichoderma cornu-damae]